MTIKHIIALAVLSCAALAGCATPKSYLDPSVPKASYDDIRKRIEPLKLRLVVEFQRNGEHYAKADSTLKDNAERVLRGTGVIVASDDKPVGEIKIVVNNIADMSNVVGKGFVTGLTFGLAGSTVMDAYEVSISVTVNGKTINHAGVKHAIYTIIGKKSAPDGVETIPPNIAFERVLEQMILRALHDMQSTGELAGVNLPSHVQWETLVNAV